MENNIQNQEQPVANRIDNEYEIDLVEIVQKLWKNRKFIIKVTAVFAVLGIIVALSTPNFYTASCTMVPQTGDKKAGGSLSGLAAMAGINLGSLSSGEVLSPSVYPQILNNVNFQKELLYSKFNIRRADVPVTYLDYKTDKRYNSFNLLRITKRYTIGLPGVIIEAIKGKRKKENSSKFIPSGIQKLTFDENKTIKGLFKSLSLNVNDKEGYISLSFTSGEPTLSAEVVQSAQRLLQKYITEFKLQKVQSNLEFIGSSYSEAKRNFEEKQAELARFRDSNISLSSALAKTQEEKLTSEYNLLLNIYSELAKQMEQAKIAVTETTPILTVIEPTIIPSEKSGPSRAIILVGFIFFGFISGGGWVLVSHTLKKNFSK